MATAKPFSWTVVFTVAPLWVQDGFTLTDEGALDMLASTISSANIGTELGAKVLHAPSPLEIARMQGYGPKSAGGGKVVRELIASTPNNNILRNALLAARDLIDTVAFVAEEGDSVSVIEKLNAALAAINARQGEAVEIEI